VPVRPRTRHVRYAPACVEFVRVRDHIGWFPLHPRDRFVPWWERRERPRNVTYVNRTHVTVVHHDAFTAAGPVHKQITRERLVLEEARTVRSTAESLPIPGRPSLRIISERQVGGDRRPPARVVTRAAVVRAAPPPAPLSFAEKLPEIRKGQGKPVPPSVASALESRREQTSVGAVPIRPAARPEATLAPRTSPQRSAPAPGPVTPPRGKKLATPERPIDRSVPQRVQPTPKTATPSRPAAPGQPGGRAEPPAPRQERAPRPQGPERQQPTPFGQSMREPDNPREREAGVQSSQAREPNLLKDELGRREPIRNEAQRQARIREQQARQLEETQRLEQAQRREQELRSVQLRQRREQERLRQLRGEKLQEQRALVRQRQQEQAQLQETRRQWQERAVQRQRQQTPRQTNGPQARQNFPGATARP